MLGPLSLYIGEQLVSHTLVEEYDHLFRKDPKFYKKKLAGAVDRTIQEYKSEHAASTASDKFPFYKSKVILLELLKYRLFRSNHYSLNEKIIRAELAVNNNIDRPGKEEIKWFIRIFEKYIQEDENLVKLAFNDNYIQKETHISEQFEAVFSQLSHFKIHIENIRKNLRIGGLKTHRIPKELTRLPQGNKKCFLGRKEDIERIRDAFQNRHQLVLIKGMPGIGKSSLAEAYIKTHYKKYKHIAWVRLQNNFKDAVLANYELIHNLKMEHHKPEQLFPACLTILKKLTGPNLLVVDNAREEAPEFYHLLPENSKWNILITGRTEREPSHIIDVDVLSEKETLKLFKSYNNNFSDEQILVLAEKTAYHTFGLEILAKTSKINEWSFNEVKDLLKTGIFKEHFGSKKFDTITSAIYRVFNATRLSEQEQWLLKNFAALPGAYHSRKFIYDILQIHNMKWKDSFSQILEDLHEKGLLQKNNPGKSFRLHSILRKIIATSLTPRPDDIQHLLKTITALLDLGNDNENLVNQTPFIPFGEAILDIFADQTFPELNTVKYNLALIYKTLGNYEQARNLLEGALETEIEHFGESHPAVAAIRYNLAEILQEVGAHEQARDLLEDALKVDIECFGENHPDVAAKKYKLAIVYQKLNNYEQARKLLESALKTDIIHFGEHHPTVANRQSKLAVIYRHLGGYHQARNLLEDALTSGIVHFGRNHPTVSASRSNLATVYQDLGDYKQARKLLENALKTDINHFGKGHPTVAVRQSNLATVYRKMGHYKRARKLLEDALKANINHFGEDYPAVAASRANLALVYKNLGDYKQSRKLLEAAVNTDIIHFGTDHPIVATRRTNLANIHEELGNYEKAVDLLRAALKSNINHFGEGHTSVASSRTNLAKVYMDLRKKEKAIRLTQKALITFKTVLGNSHPQTLSTEHFLEKLKNE
ncbi:MAG: tetratricopeptide repeat protein [Balneolaceae bacterium]|nr:tetratricopeptide repeat protein [Balneolaceae bacterium]